MRDFLKRYRIQLEIVTPVYIGSGQELTKKEYIYYKNEKEAWIPDKGKLLKSIINKGLTDKFERYMLDGKEPLLDWMQNQRYKDREIKELCVYHLDCSKALENLNRPVAIQEFIKDAYGMPYIPGSSLKGAIRTSLLGNRILSNPKKYDNIRQNVIKANYIRNGKPDKKYLLSEGKKVENVAFHILNINKENSSDAKNDELKGIYISDSFPLKPDCLVLCQKVDVNLERKKNSLNILRESIKPGTIVEFEMTIDTSITNIDEKEILQALKRVYEFYQEVYVKKFIDKQKEKSNLYLGGGCGFGTKTVLYELLGERERVKIASQLMHIKFAKHGHRNDVRRGVSPHMLKCTNYDGKICEMGKCKIEIIQI